MQKIVYLSGDDTVQLMEKDDAENYRENCYQQLLESTKNEGIVANDEDSEDYESDIALQSGYDADGECQVHDFASIMKQYEAANPQEFEAFSETLRETDGEVELLGFDGLRNILERSDPESSSIY